MRTAFRRASALAFVALLTACATPGPLLTNDLSGLRGGIAATRAEARTGFAAANTLARQEAISRKLSLAEITLREEDFPTPVPTAVAAAWDSAFGNLDAYAAALQKLVAPELAGGASDAIGGLANELNTGAAQARIPPSLTGAFATFAGALLQARNEKTATDVMRKTDPAFQVVAQTMAGAVGADATDRSSLQFVVSSNWTALQAQMRADYSVLAPAQKAERSRVVTDYVTSLDNRDVQLANLAQLHDSLLALGAAHAAAAQGRPGDAAFWIQRISGWLDDVKARSTAAAKVAGAAR